MTDEQRLSLDRMRELIQEFVEGKIPYHVMVYRLESAESLAGFRDHWFLNHWFDVWDPVYEIDVNLNCESQCVDFEKVSPLLRKMFDFLALAQHELDLPEAG